MRDMGRRRGPALIIRSIAITGDVERPEFRRFTDSLCKALSELGSVLYLDSGRFCKIFGDRAESVESVAGWMSALENANRFVVCVADAEPTPWTLHSLRQSDRILVVRVASASPDPLPVERIIYEEQKFDRISEAELVVLHAQNHAVFAGSKAWFEPRHLARRHHVRENAPGDVARVARLLAGKAIGIALGGGGSRGFAHIGVLRAIEEAQIPVDAICGVSMGSIISALYAMGHGWRDILAMAAEKMTGRLTSVTMPIVSLTNGVKFRRLLKSFFGDVAIEDLGMSYFCTSCNLSTSEIVVHRNGPLVRGIYASNAIPVVLPPALMDGHMLVDGGVLNNQPGDILKEFCGGSVIVVNVSPRRETTVDTGLSDLPSPWRVLRSRLNPFEPAIRVPGLSATMIRTLMVASERKSREIERIADYYLRPPLDRFRLDEFRLIDEIVETGYVYAVEEIRKWKEAGRYPPPSER
jgi:NTE family protein/lysophospholipid hydrolase